MSEEEKIIEEKEEEKPAEEEKKLEESKAEEKKEEKKSPKKKDSKKVNRDKPIPESKINLVNELADKIKAKKTILIASTNGLPGSQFQQIKKSLRGKAEVKVAKKSLILRAIDKVGKGSLNKLKEQIGADIALFFSDIDAFELSGILADNESPTKAKAGDVVDENIDVEPGPTDLIPGPAISELGSVGLKVAVEDGKLAIKEKATIAKAGDVVDGKLAGVLAKLGIEPMKVGFEPIAAYDSESDKVYVGIKIDKEATLENMREMIGKALGFAVNIDYATKETIGYFISKAGVEAKALESLEEKSEEEESKEDSEQKAEEKPVEKEEEAKEEKPAEEEKKVEESKVEEKKEEETSE